MITIETPQKNLITEEPPESLNPKNVVFWSETYKKLIITNKDGKRTDFTIKGKAQRFVENDLYRYDATNKQFLCLPILGYNSTTYRLKYNKLIKDFECSCQGFQTRLRKLELPLVCCHQLGLKLQFKIWHYNKTHPEYQEYISEEL